MKKLLIIGIALTAACVIMANTNSVEQSSFKTRTLFHNEISDDELCTMPDLAGMPWDKDKSNRGITLPICVGWNIRVDASFDKEGRLLSVSAPYRFTSTLRRPRLRSPVQTNGVSATSMPLR